jgi:hypothetical protein
MKKIIAVTTGIFSIFIPALPAFAQIGVSACPTGLGNICNLSSDKFGSFISQLITFLIVVAILVAVFFLIWGGIKWIMSGGDKAKVESARSTIIGAIVGLIIVFLAYFIISIVAKAFGIDIGALTLPTFGA